MKKKIEINNSAVGGTLVLEEVLKVLESLFECKYESCIKNVSEEMNAGDRVVLIICPDEPMLFTSYENRNEAFEGFEFDYGEMDDEYGLCIVYDSECIVTLGDNDYLVEAPLMITNIDCNGNECSISAKDAMLAVSFMTERGTFIEVDGKAFPAFRLNS